jgi:hypothetical protein
MSDLNEPLAQSAVIVLLTPDVLLWTVDKNLEALATRFRVAFTAAIR